MEKYKSIGPTPIEVFRKDSEGNREMLSEAAAMGFTGITKIEKNKIYVLKGNPGANAEGVLKQIAEEILIDPVIESYKITEVKKPGVNVCVFLKEGVFDSEGQRVIEALKITGIQGFESASRATRYIIQSESEAGIEEYEELSRKLLYNPVIEKAEIEKVE